MMNIGVNFFGTKREMYHDFEGTILRMKDAGLNSAEVCLIFPPKMEMTEEMQARRERLDFKEITGGIWEFESAQEKLDKVKALKLNVISAQVMMGMTPDPEEMIENLQKIKTFAKKNQLKYIVMSLAKNLEVSKSYVSVFNQMTKELAEIGITFVYHNHEVECADEEGTTAFDYLMENCPKMKLELDVGWVKFAGKSPIEYIRKYKDRIVLLHLKDIIEDAGVHNRDNCFTAIGEGTILLADIIEELKTCPLLDENGIIIDQDASFTDIMEDLTVGVKNIEAVCK